MELKGILLIVEGTVIERLVIIINFTSILMPQVDLMILKDLTNGKELKMRRINLSHGFDYASIMECLICFYYLKFLLTLDISLMLLSNSSLLEDRVL